MELLEMTLVKTETYKLKPFGRFRIKTNATKNDEKKVNVLDYDTLSFNCETGMSYTTEQEKVFVKYMIKHKTDILVDSRGDWYTRIGESWVKVRHKKLYAYNTFLSQRDYEDSNSLEAWNDFLNK